MNDPYGAFLHLLPERTSKSGPLAGMRIALKDNIQVRGERTTCGSRVLERYRSPYDATVVRHLEEAGAVLVGKTNMDEFAMGSSTEHSAYQVTRNPWNSLCSPGGSSGGSAAAVAGRLVSMALGSDTGGSVRQPAAFCGILGLKPTYGQISRHGLVSFSSSLDTVGLFATRTEELRTLLNVLAQSCPYDSTHNPHPIHPLSRSCPKIGVPWSLLEGLSGEVLHIFKSALAHVGGEIVPIDLTFLKDALSIYYILAPAEASTNLARFDGVLHGCRNGDGGIVSLNTKARALFGKEVKRRILLGTYVLSQGQREAYYHRAERARASVTYQLNCILATTCDVIAMPTTPTSAFPLESISDPMQMYLQDIYTIPANLSGLPAISIPMGLDQKGLPLGMQLMTHRFGEGSLLDLSARMERALDFPNWRPPCLN